MAHDSSTIAYVAARIRDLFDDAEDCTATELFDTPDNSHHLEVTVGGHAVTVTVS